MSMDEQIADHAYLIAQKHGIEEGEELRPRMILQAIAHCDQTNDAFLASCKDAIFSSDFIDKAGQKFRNTLMTSLEQRKFNPVIDAIKDWHASRAAGGAKSSIKSKTLPPPMGQSQTLQHAFMRDPYIGNADKALFEWLTHNEILFRERTSGVLYGKFATAAQASGTGKSRTLVRLNKHGVFVIYINLRSDDDETNYPLRDDVPAEILHRIDSKESDYGAKCCAFFAALFIASRRTLHSVMLQANGDKVRAAQLWDLRMNPAERNFRADFFSTVREEYTGIERSILELGTQSLDRSATTSEASNTAAESGDAEYSLDRTLAENKPKERKYNGFANLASAYIDLYRSFPEIFDGTPEPKIVIVVDEANYMRNPTHKYSPADVLCRVISNYSRINERIPIWTLFASTESKLADFAPPSHIFNSARVSEAGERIVVPFTAFGWDQLAPELGTYPAEEAARADHILLYGRPLWATLRKAHNSLSEFEAVVRQKLVKNTDTNTLDGDAALALLSQRFCLNVAFGHPDAVEFLDKQIASHMRICIATTEDRTWRDTTYPSEPLLSHVAAQVLHSSTGGGVESALDYLMRKLVSGMISMGPNGELVSRLLWLLCKDMVVRDLAPASSDQFSADLTYCRMVPVTTLLEAMFNNISWENDGAQDAATAAFADAYINMSHWIAMDQEIEKSKKRVEDLKKRDKETIDKTWDAGEWLLRLWIRTAAVQCSHQQRDIDKLIPVYFNKPNQEDRRRMGYILVSDKLGQNVSASDLNVISRKRLQLDSSADLPYIAVLMDLGSGKTEVTATYPTRAPAGEPPCLRIHAKGLERETYKFLSTTASLATKLNQLALRNIVFPHTLPILEDLKAQMCFGSSLEHRHMVWEQKGKGRKTGAVE